MQPDTGDFILYTTQDGALKIDVRVLHETVWLTQRQMAELFQKDVRTINEHIKNTFDEGELDQISTIRNFRIVQQEGVRSVERDVNQKAKIFAWQRITCKKRKSIH